MEQEVKDLWTVVCMIYITIGGFQIGATFACALILRHIICTMHEELSRMYNILIRVSALSGIIILSSGVILQFLQLGDPMMYILITGFLIILGTILLVQLIVVVFKQIMKLVKYSYDDLIKNMERTHDKSKGD